MDVIKTYIPKRFRNKKLVNTGSVSGSTTLINSGNDISPSSFVDSDTFYSMFELVDLSGTPAIKAKHEFFSVAGVTAYGTGTVATGGSGSSVYVLDVLNSTDTGSALSANMGRVLNEGKLNRSEISSWALGAVKPAYGISEITGLSASLSGKSAVGHEHTISEISDFAHVHQWNDIQNIPSVFAPDVHDHYVADILNFPTSMPASDVYAWAKASTKPGYVWSEIGGKPTEFTPSAHTHSQYLLTSAYTASDVFAKVLTQDGHGTGLDTDTLDSKHGSYFCDYDERTLGYNVNYNALSYDFQNKSFIVSPVHSKSYTGQTNYPFNDYGQMITFGGLNTLFPFQLAVSENANKVKIRSKYRPTNNTVIDAAWADVYTSNSANRTDVDWAAKNMTVQTDITLNGLTSTNKSLKTLLDKFDIDTNGNIVVKTNLYSTGEVTAYSSGTGVSGLKLMGDLNANEKNIIGANHIYGGNAYIGNVGAKIGLHEELIGSTIAAFDDIDYNYYFADNKLIYDSANNIFSVTGQVTASEFKFGNYSFKQSANGLSICFNGVEQAYITNTGQYGNS